MKKQKGITLVALVITIIILIILAGVTIQMTLGDNGLITKARLAADLYKNAENDERVMVASTDIDNLPSGGEENNENNETNLYSEYRNDQGYFLIGEVYTTDIGNYTAALCVKDNIKIFENELLFSEYTNNPKIFSFFNVYYDGNKWHITNISESDLLYATDISSEEIQYTSFNDVNWGFATTVHYYLYIQTDDFFVRTDLDLGTGEVAKNYNANTETFSLPIPTKMGYEFIGWTGSNGNEPTMNVTISKGSSGDKYYKANWRQTYRLVAEVITTSTGGYDAAVKVIDYVNNTENIYVYNTVNNSTGHNFNDFNLKYNPNWRITKIGDVDLKYNTTDYGITYRDIGTLSWGYGDTVHYYIAVF